MMRTLGLIGAPIIGDRFPQERRIEMLRKSDAAQALKKAEEIGEAAYRLNPRGYYEIPGVVMRGLTSLRARGEYFGGRIVKIVAPGLPRTNPDLIWKGVLCLRDPRHVAESQRNLLSGVKVNSVHGWDDPRFNVDPQRYFLEMSHFMGYLKQQGKEFRDRFLIVDYEEFLKKPAQILQDLILHFDLNPTGSQIRNALDNIDTRLRRSPDEFVAWPAKVEVMGQKAEQVYSLLKQFDEQEIDAVVATQAQMRDEIRRERTFVFDWELGALVAPQALRKKAQDSEFKLRFQAADVVHGGEGLTLEEKAKAGQIKRAKAGLDFRVDKTYEGVVDESYTVAQPADVGDVIQQKVKYAGKIMPVEQAHRLHRIRRNNLEVQIDPKKLKQRIAEINGTVDADSTPKRVPTIRQSGNRQSLER